MANRFAKFLQLGETAIESAPAVVSGVNRFAKYATSTAKPPAAVEAMGAPDASPFEIASRWRQMSPEPVAEPDDAVSGLSGAAGAARTSVGGGMLIAEENNRRAALQGVAPYVEDMKPIAPVVNQDDGGGLYYQGPDGREELVEPSKHLVFRNPGTGQLTVYERDPKFEESRIKSLGRFILPGLVTGPVTGPARALPAATTAAAAAPRPMGAVLAADRAAHISRDIQAFERGGVRPFGPAFSQGPVAGLSKQISEIPYVGAPVRNALEESLMGAAVFSGDVARGFGDVRTAREAGQVVEGGITRFRDARAADVVEEAIAALPNDRISGIITQPTRATSLKTKQAALYERAWRLIPQEMQRGRSVEGLTRVMGNPTNTRQVIEEIVQRNMRMTNQSAAARAGTDAAALPVQGGLLRQMIEAVRTPQWTANLQTLRDMRSEFRRLASGMSDTEKNTLRLSDLDRIQSAITKDMVTLLERNAAAYRLRANPTPEAIARFEQAYGRGAARPIIENPTADAVADMRTARGFERAIKEFRRADQFTRLSALRLETIERLFNADNAEMLARNIMQATLSNARGNLQMLHTLSRTLRPEEMRQVSAFLISELGRPVGSARGISQEIDFSVSSFLTRWNNMTPEARSMLFGGEHAQAVDDLVRVVSRLANVEALANTSRSATNAISVGGLLATGSALMTGGWQAALLPGITGFGAAVLFSRPFYVRWVARYARLKANALQGGHMARRAASDPDKQVLAHINRLALMARDNPELIPVLRSISLENGIGEGSEKQEQVEPDYGDHVAQ